MQVHHQPTALTSSAALQDTDREALCCISPIVTTILLIQVDTASQLRQDAKTMFTCFSSVALVEVFSSQDYNTELFVIRTVAEGEKDCA